MEKKKTFWDRIKYVLLAIGTAVLTFLGIRSKRKSKKQIEDNIKNVKENEEVIANNNGVIETVKEKKEEIKGVIEKNEEVINKYSDLRNRD